MYFPHPRKSKPFTELEVIPESPTSKRRNLSNFDEEEKCGLNFLMEKSDSPLLLKSNHKRGANDPSSYSLPRDTYQKFCEEMKCPICREVLDNP